MENKKSTTIEYLPLLRQEQAVMHGEDIWNPFFLTPTDHAQMMDRLYGGNIANTEPISVSQPVIDPNYPNEANPQGM